MSKSVRRSIPSDIPFILGGKVFLLALLFGAFSQVSAGHDRHRRIQSDRDQYGQRRCCFAEGKILLRGLFATLGGTARNCIVREGDAECLTGRRW